MYVKSSGDRKGTNEQPGKIPSGPKPGPTARLVQARTHEHVREVWLRERWRTSVTSKVAGYMGNVVMGKANAVPKGIPSHVRDIVRRCFAQACLEMNITDLPAQRDEWYPSAVAAARSHMK